MARKTAEDDDLTFTWFPYVGGSERKDGDSPIGFVGYQVDDGWMAAYAFSLTAESALDLVGFVFEWVGTADNAYERVLLQLTKRPTRTLPAQGASARQLRAAANYTGALQQARLELYHIIRHPSAATLVGSDRVVTKRGRGGGPSEHDLARLVVRFDKLRIAGVSPARPAAAAQLGISEGTAKNWLERAERAGLWRPGRGRRPGMPTARAFELVAEHEGEN